MIFTLCQFFVVKVLVTSLSSAAEALLQKMELLVYSGLQLQITSKLKNYTIH